MDILLFSSYQKKQQICMMIFAY